MEQNLKMSLIHLDNESYNTVLDRNFSELIQPNNVEDIFTVEDFFNLYESLFYNIDKEGVVNSHRYLINKSAEYLGINIENTTDVEALINEITDLRNSLLESNKKLINQ